MSTPEKRRSPLSEGERAELLLMKMNGHTIPSIAERFGITERTVYRYVNLVKEQAKFEDVAKTKPRELGGDPKQVITRKAFIAVEAGLDCEDDPYKRGNLGATVLKGVGEFQGDTTVNVNQVFANIPPEFKQFFVTGDEKDGDVIDVEVKK